MKCSKCESAIFAYANVRYKLCVPCNWSRLHNGKDYTTEMRKKQKEYQNRAIERQKAKILTTTPKKKLPIPQRSLKGIEQHKELLKVKHEVRQAAFDNDEYYCKGCGKATGLDCSHNVGVGQTSELSKDYDNLVLLCRLCHIKYESNDPKLMNELLCIDLILEYLRINNPERYYKKMYKLNRIK